MPPRSGAATRNAGRDPSRGYGVKAGGHDGLCRGGVGGAAPAASVARVTGTEYKEAPRRTPLNGSSTASPTWPCGGRIRQPYKVAETGPAWTRVSGTITAHSLCRVTRGDFVGSAARFAGKEAQLSARMCGDRAVSRGGGVTHPHRSWSESSDVGGQDPVQLAQPIARRAARRFGRGPPARPNLGARLAPLRSRLTPSLGVEFCPLTGATTRLREQHARTPSPASQRPGGAHETRGTREHGRGGPRTFWLARGWW